MSAKYKKLSIHTKKEQHHNGTRMLFISAAWIKQSPSAQLGEEVPDQPKTNNKITVGVIWCGIEIITLTER